MNIGRLTYQLGYQISPIILTRGIASDIPGKMLPIVALTEAVNFTSGLLHGDLNLSLENAFAWFEPTSGATLVNNEVGMYPFANQIVAANAMIKQPLSVSMMMICPNKESYWTKMPTLTALKATLELHMQNGGTFTVITPSFIYSDCLLVNMSDASGGATKQVQYAWQLDFIQPLLTEEAAKKYVDLLNNMEVGLPVQGGLNWSAIGSTLGNAMLPQIPS
jgi:hypothetical protein